MTLTSRITADFGIDPIVLGRGSGIAAVAVRAEWRSRLGGGSASEAGRGYHRRRLKLEKLLGGMMCGFSSVTSGELVRGSGVQAIEEVRSANVLFFSFFE